MKHFMVKLSEVQLEAAKQAVKYFAENKNIYITTRQNVVMGGTYMQLNMAVRIKAKDRIIK